jgi:hypothetical protein
MWGAFSVCSVIEPGRRGHGKGRETVGAKTSWKAVVRVIQRTEYSCNENSPEQAQQRSAVKGTTRVHYVFPRAYSSRSSPLAMGFPEGRHSPEKSTASARNSRGCRGFSRSGLFVAVCWPVPVVLILDFRLLGATHLHIPPPHSLAFSAFSRIARLHLFQPPPLLARCISGPVPCALCPLLHLVATGKVTLLVHEPTRPGSAQP